MCVFRRRHPLSSVPQSPSQWFNILGKMVGHSSQVFKYKFLFPSVLGGQEIQVELLNNEYVPSGQDWHWLVTFERYCPGAQGLQGTFSSSRGSVALIVSHIPDSNQ
eukprot:TRINITY_DN13646_c0_g1_i1.p2 TRINITY_DN13646_c0_g1~~TRINITY_DN13646_c0_g1_i1.p2  ORF type:complete len:106 (-),score=3.82 TRINITY_DN13646_c0_g1_i1:344-661(-)